MGHRPFRLPLFLKLDSLANYRATSPWEALDYLDLYWRGHQAESYHRARSACQLAVDGFVDAEVAREAVATAARQAGLLQRAWRPLVPLQVAAHL